MAGAYRRWWILGIFLSSSALNFLDRQLLAAYALQIESEFKIDEVGYGWIIAAFSITYALCAPVMGLLIDRVGLRRGAAASVGTWSLVSLTTGLVPNFAGLLTCRAGLGIAESGGIPSAGKAVARFLPSEERALGTALGQVGITLGSMAAPLLSTRLPWRQGFVCAGALGLAWVPIWLWISRQEQEAPRRSSVQVASDPRIWGLCLANLFAMVTYSVWLNWVTIFLTKGQQVPAAIANSHYAWWPPLAATLGGFAGGWATRVLARRSVGIQAARWRVCAVSAALMLGTVLIPFAPGPAWATLGICTSYFLTLAISVNLYAMPMELFGEHRAAFSTALLTASYGLMQLISPAIGALIKYHGFAPVFCVIAVCPAIAVLILRLSRLHE